MEFNKALLTAIFERGASSVLVQGNPWTITVYEEKKSFPDIEGPLEIYEGFPTLATGTVIFMKPEGLTVPAQRPIQLMTLRAGCGTLFRITSGEFIMQGNIRREPWLYSYPNPKFDPALTRHEIRYDEEDGEPYIEDTNPESEMIYQGAPDIVFRSNFFHPDMSMWIDQLTISV